MTDSPEEIFFLNDSFRRLISTHSNISNIKSSLISGLKQQKIRMNLNELSGPPSPHVISKIKESCDKVFRYPDPNWTALVKKLSIYSESPENRIVVGAGSDELIAAAGRITLSPFTEVVAPTPSFSSYDKTAAFAGAKIINIPLRKDGSNDVEQTLNKVSSATRLVFFATANNPTGVPLSSEDIEKVVKGVPDTALLIIDEAYFEFAMEAGCGNSLKILRKRTGPWAILRTFSKAFGLAGLRVGYLICGSEQVYLAFNAARTSFNVNRIAQIAAEAALEDLKYMQTMVETTIGQRQYLYRGLVNLGCKPFDSVANFVMAKAPKSAKLITQELGKQNILISQINQNGFENFIRVTASRKKETDIFLGALRVILRS